MIHYTSFEQSKRLLELGMNPESADMYYIEGSNAIGINVPFVKESERSGIPCWSVGALLGVMPKSIPIVNTYYGYELYASVKGYAIDWWDVKRLRKLHASDEEFLIDVCFETIVWLLENGYIKKGE